MIIDPHIWKIAVLLSVAALLMFVSGCGNPPAPVITACPEVQQWTKKQENDLADALALIPDGSPIWDMHDDWKATRERLKRCKQAQP
jgi:hypothetical protein